MQVLAIALFGAAVALSAWLLPNNMFLLRLLSVSAARALALVLALVFWVGCGRLDSWGSNRVTVALGTIVGTLALAGGCLFIQMTRDDNVPAPWSWVYRVTAGLLPICFMASVYLRSGKMFIIVSLLAPVAGILLGTAWKPLNAIYIANQPKSKEQLENEALLAQLERIPAGAGPECFVELIKPDETWDVRTKVLARIEATPDWTARLSAMLDGDKRLNVLYVLTRKTGSLPDEVLARCWSAAESVAREQTELLKKGNVPKKSDEEMLNDSVHEVGNQSEAARDLHWKEIAAVQEFLIAAKAPVNSVFLDSWVRKSQLHRIPEDAGIVPVVEYAGINEAWDVREEALARIARIPDSTAKLAELLDGPHRLDALVVLAHRTDALPEDLLERCWRAAGLIAREMAKGIEQGEPPARKEVHKLRTSVGSIWIKLGPDKERRLADLVAARDVVRAAGDEWDKLDFTWAEEALAAAKARSAEKRK